MPSSIRQLDAEDFPALLREIPDLPASLSVQGVLPDESEHRFLAVVGSRKATQYGRQAVEHLIGGLRGYPVCVVSGLALGIDAAAHKAALDAGLATIAVPGSGLDSSVLYPRSNVALAERILHAGGALVSEFEPAQRAAPWTFPQRNRIMAGLAHAVLAIEATPRSGTLITARLASEYNRDLLVVPGSIFAESSQGVHQFLKLGATPVTTPEDILAALRIETRDTSTAPESLDLSAAEQEICDALAEPLTRDELLASISLSATEANILLSKLELDGVIVEKLGKVWRV